MSNTFEVLKSAIGTYTWQVEMIEKECKCKGLHILHDPKHPERGDIDGNGKCKALLQAERYLENLTCHLKGFNQGQEAAWDVLKMDRKLSRKRLPKRKSLE